ncbi:TadE/TadG family type IV pilus assembly protein [Marinicrinis sediminis]|uniref:TadE/TadG family type IV pilus assembly protein n=1 Tax=Marinicrinis sediminis TaxID=1652465 RepID=A0ABW5RE84_9BACL
MKRTFWKREEGGITLEAAIVLPFLMMFVLAMISMIRIQSAHMALQTAVSETTKVISTHMYPVKLLYDQGMNTGIGQAITGAREQLQTASEFTDAYAGLLPDPLPQMLDAFSKEIGSQGGKMIDQAKMAAMKPILAVFAEDVEMDSERLQVTEVTLPNLQQPGQAYFGVEASYVVKLPIPFYEKELTITKRAKERVWIGEP